MSIDGNWIDRLTGQYAGRSITVLETELAAIRARLARITPQDSDAVVRSLVHHRHAIQTVLDWSSTVCAD